MKVELDIRKSAQENAAAYYDEAKRLREKATGAEKAAKDTERKLRELEKEIEREKAKPEAKVRVKREKEWFERFRWFRSEDGLLCIAGRDAGQNEAVVARHLEPGDLFFHAEIHGAPATVLKGGEKAGEKPKREAAQFAASYSSAWKLGSSTVDVYAVKPPQVSKRSEAGEFAGKGGFIIRGEREWFRNSELGLLIGLGEKGVESAPALRGKGEMKDAVSVKVGDLEKGDAAKLIAKRLGEKADLDEILQALPAGKFAVE